MDYCNILVLALLLLSSNAGAAECEAGWVAYKDELCVKSFPNLVTYQEAKELCTSQGNEISKASLVMVKEEDMQNLLVTYTNDAVDYAWLGSKYDEDAAEFKWEDGEPMTYTNWDVDYPRITNASNACVELVPVNAKRSVKADGKWIDGNCQRRNMVICQRTLSWSLQDAINEIIRIRKQHQEDLEVVHRELDAVNSRVVPVGSIYVEYYTQPSPQTLWPSLQWQDITSTYAGLFFRAAGGGAASWGSTQTECAPRINEVTALWRPAGNGSFPSTVSIPANGYSEYFNVGTFFNSGGQDLYREGLKLQTQGCEVRPRNQAIRVWKRTS